MTRKEYQEMCAPDFEWYTLPSGKKIKITNQDQFMKMWEDIFPTLKEHRIKEYMEAAKPHTQITDANPNMAWLYDRLLMLCVARNI